MLPGPLTLVLAETIAMPGKQAKVVTPSMLKRMLRFASQTTFPARDRAMILLSVKAGLRACEIARPSPQATQAADRSAGI